jgi:hypothetical protein
MDPEQINLRAAWAILLAARAHLLAYKNPDFEADKVLQKALLKTARKYSRGRTYTMNWLVYVGPKVKNYADVRLVKF